jgi:ATP-dependent protease Clp ATPase subunit
LTRLQQDYDVAKAEENRFIDEIDKIARKTTIHLLHVMFLEKSTTGFIEIIRRAVVNVPPKGGRKHRPKIC